MTETTTTERQEAIMFQTADLAMIELAGRFAVDARLADGAVVSSMAVSVAELQAMAQGGYTQVWCLTCGESVADCPRAREYGVVAPAAWSTMGEF